MGKKCKSIFKNNSLVDQANAKKFELKYFIEQYEKSLGGALPLNAGAIGRFVEGDVSQYDPENVDLQIYEEAKRSKAMEKDIQKHMKEVAELQVKEMEKQAKEQPAVDRSTEQSK